MLQLVPALPAVNLPAPSSSRGRTELLRVFLVSSSWNFYFWRVRTGIGENARRANDWGPMSCGEFMKLELNWAMRAVSAFFRGAGGEIEH